MRRAWRVFTFAQRGTAAKPDITKPSDFTKRDCRVKIRATDWLILLTLACNTPSVNIQFRIDFL
jgi:hypothetical protein